MNDVGYTGKREKIMTQLRKYNNLYGRQEAYKKSEKGKQALKKYESSDARRAKKREWARKKRGTIIDKQQWFIDNYGDPKKILANLEDENQREAIELYYGLSGAKSINQTAIAKILNTSQQTVSQILRDARKQLTLLKETTSNSCQEIEETRSQYPTSR